MPCPSATPQADIRDVIDAELVERPSKRTRTAALRQTALCSGLAAALAEVGPDNVTTATGLTQDGDVTTARVNTVQGHDDLYNHDNMASQKAADDGPEAVNDSDDQDGEDDGSSSVVDALMYALTGTSPRQQQIKDARQAALEAGEPLLPHALDFLGPIDAAAGPGLAARRAERNSAIIAKKPFTIDILPEGTATAIYREGKQVAHVTIDDFAGIGPRAFFRAAQAFADNLNELGAH